MQESKEQQRIYNLFQKGVYMLVMLECLIIFFGNSDYAILTKLLKSFAKIPMLFPPLNIKFTELALIALVAIGTKPKKNQDLHIGKSIVLPIVVGLFLMFFSLTLIEYTFDPKAFKIVPVLNIWQLAYASCSIIGVMVTMIGADNISKLMKTKLGKDRWNVEEESFDQNKELVKTDTSINIPYQFYFNKKVNDGWLNINPFRGSLIIGTPGSGKSFGIINPTIRQMVQKGFSLCVYDFKFPQLAEIAYYQYRVKKAKDKNYKHKFLVLNLNQVEKSLRVNPLKREYISTLAEAQEIADSIVSALQGGSSKGGGGSENFFFQSAVNFLSACIAFLANYENGRYSSIPHLLALLSRSYQEIFDTLFSYEEIGDLLSTFKSSYDHKAFDQLEGQIGTLKVQLSRLSSKESYWIFSGDQVNLKLSDPNDPSILVLASDPNTQDTTSALYASALNRMLRLVNQRGNLPMGFIADEFPTIYIHKVDNTIATARSNKVAIMLGFQELPQLKQFYKKEVAETIVSIVGNIFSGSVRDKGTLDWQERIYGKVKQKSQSMSVNNNQTTVSIQERMDNLIPAGKIASLKTGEMVGIVAQDAQNTGEKYTTSAFNGKINLNMSEIKHEEENYFDLPTYYDFKDDAGVDRKNDVLMTNYRRIKKEVELIVNEFKN